MIHMHVNNFAIYLTKYLWRKVEIVDVHIPIKKMLILITYQYNILPASAYVLNPRFGNAVPPPSSTSVI